MRTPAAAKPYLLAVDIGTTSTKTLLVSREGQVMASHAVEYPLYTSAADRAEQDPLDIFRAVLQGVGIVMRKLDARPGDILCASFSSAMHSLLAVGADATPLTPCMTWADNRSARLADELKQSALGQAIYGRTGTPIHPMSPLTKLMWLREQQPELLQRAFKWIGIKEFVFAKLFGRYVIDYPLASATGLLQLERLDWDEEALALAGVTRGQLSEPVPALYRLEGMKSEYAEAMGLDPGTPFVVGASDGALANLGVGATQPGVLAVTIGTSGAVRGLAPRPAIDPLGRLFCYALLDDQWVIGGPINNGGIMLRWVRDRLATLEAEEGRRRGLDPYDYLTELAAEVPAGSEGLLFLPLLSGERAPYWNANARGVFFGLSLYHDKKHMIRAVLEGVMFRIHSVAAALQELAGPAMEIRASGGFARSVFWRQMLADVLGARLGVPEAIESSALGAAMLGLLAMGEIADLRQTADWVQLGAVHEPNENDHRTYKQLTSIYENVYHQLKDQFDAISAFQALSHRSAGG